MKLNLKPLRSAKKWTIDQLAEVSGLSRGYISQLETGKRQPGPETITLLMEVFGVGAADLISDATPATVPAVAVAGRIGAGDEIFLTDDHAKGDGLYHVECPPQLSHRGVVAVEVRGDSMEPIYSEGDVLFYSRTTADGVPTEAVGKKVIAETAGGRVWVKQLKIGTEPRRFHLLSLNPTGRNMLDEPVKWAAPVRLHLPKEFVRKLT